MVSIPSWNAAGCSHPLKSEQLLTMLFFPPYTVLLTFTFLTFVVDPKEPATRPGADAVPVPIFTISPEVILYVKATLPSMRHQESISPFTSSPHVLWTNEARIVVKASITTGEMSAVPGSPLHNPN